MVSPSLMGGSGLYGYVMCGGVEGCVVRTSHHPQLDWPVGLTCPVL